MTNELLKYMQKPNIYEPSTHKFWDDEYISKGMLEAHLDKEFEGATRNYDYVLKSVDWIVSIAPPANKNKLLDLGCGPGIYTELFYQNGYNVTGVDLSKRSIDYARNSSKSKNLSITYICQDYLKLDSKEKYDVITLIYCDFGVLSDENRKLLLEKMYDMLRPDGLLIFDVFTPIMHQNKEEYKRWNYCGTSSFWCDKPHGCLESLYQYEKNTVLRQSIIVANDEIKCYNIWEHMFTCEELFNAIRESGFGDVNFYSDILGNKYFENSKTICSVARKN